MGSRTDGRWCTLMIHSYQHSQEDVVLNPLLFSDWIQSGGNIQILQDLANPTERLVLCIPPAQGDTLAAKSAAKSSRVEISLSKTLAESFGLMPFARVYVGRVGLEEVEIDFVELAFRKQFLQRGNMWRFKKSMVSRAVYIGQNVSIDGIQATIQEVGSHGAPVKSGLISDKTHFIFRSRSTRIIWLVQISLEMWEFDQNGDLYFEKFLYKFAGPLLDRWKALATSHSLTVTFFCRTLFPAQNSPESFGVGSKTHNDDKDGDRKGAENWSMHQRRSDGMRYVDHFKVVIENAADIDKVAFLRVLKTEFLAWPDAVGWNIGAAAGSSTRSSRNNNTKSGSEVLAVPSDATGGNFLEAINTTLNVLDKHYMDRDLQRTGNSIVAISAGTGFYRVQLSHAKITKQRMMDGGIGIDFVSLSQPPLHVVPLFQIDCQSLARGQGKAGAEISDFYEMPHWIAVSYVDCERDFFESFQSSSRRKNQNRLDYRWTGLDDFSSAFGNSPSSIDGGSDGGRPDPWSDWRLVFSPPPFPSYLNGHALAYSKADGPFTLEEALPLALPALLQKLLLSACGADSSANTSNSINTSGDGDTTHKPTAVSAMPFWGGLLLPPGKFKSSQRSRFLRDGPALRPLPSIMPRHQSHPTSNPNLDTPRRSTASLANSIANSMWGSGLSGAGVGVDYSSHGGRPASGSFALDAQDFELDAVDVGRDMHDSGHCDAVAYLAWTGINCSTLSSSQRNNRQSDSKTLFGSPCDANEHIPIENLSVDALKAMMFAHDNALDRESCIPHNMSTTTMSSASNNNINPNAHGSFSHGPTSITVSNTFSTPSQRRRSTGLVVSAAEKAMLGLSVGSGREISAGVVSFGGLNVAAAGQDNRSTPRGKGFERNGQPEREACPEARLSSSQGTSASIRLASPRLATSPNYGSRPESHEDRSSFLFQSRPDRSSASYERQSYERHIHDRPPLPGATSSSFRQSHGFKLPLAESPKANVGFTSGINTADAAASRQMNHTNISVSSNSSDKQDTSSKEQIEEMLAYRARYGINPFKKEEGAMFLRTRTHNRRRWSHVFPWGWGDYTKNLPSETGFTGLNWKSLCQPAILPLTTDYIPQVPDLKNSYSNSSPYQLLLDHKCAFDSPESLLQEMVCQRLSQEFQLVEAESGQCERDGAGPSFNPLPYFEYAMKMDNSSAGAATAAALQLHQQTHTGASRLFFILSVGHRIQFLFYEPSSRNVKVTQLTSIRDGSQVAGSTGSTASYTYLLWVPQLNKFQPMTQHFTQFPAEFPWNKVDSILLGDGELDTGGGDSVRAKRLRYAVLPDICKKESDVLEYMGKLEKLVAFFQKYLGKLEKEEISISMDKSFTSSNAPGNASSASSTSSSTNKVHRTNVVRLWLKPPQTSTPKWLFLKHDASTSSRQVFHLELHWLVSDSWLVDDFVSVLFRRCSSWGLRIAQIPEFFCSANLQVHPFRGQPYVTVPLESTCLPSINSYCGPDTGATNSIGGGNSSIATNSSSSSASMTSNAVALQALGYPSQVTLVENLYFRERSHLWIEDDSRSTDWASLRLPVPEYSANDNKSDDPARKSPFSFLSRSILRTGTAAAIVNQAKRRRANLDRQYMHRVGFACVRVGAMGFMWLLNSSVRVNDVSLSVEEKREMAIRTLRELDAFGQTVGFVYGLLIDIIEGALSVQKD